ncbi:hypothetical protein [Aneurinibacillus aneurinilyticus]|uniref:YqzN/YkzM domain-containing protein n=1 Tax=Aneurinibacillus aneurinilyticus ATCC 12856 TaxID=649747 RepID=U1WNQ3_ANEAE|nr:hypothetical protein [Aneurinibacillus aneurinilyticus]ERI10229.1 hypothetical protein HMPREF0083_01673 [Aneurinibacillus aneurinilyticus ATCC 12856]MED0705857.1 hypothetical protein [Aneurinibacillus aneurinilyticus]MED0722668.1 hypothetical protein [Aneurinibacillus aneurinilyticus]MED0731412.1 hypothetical protein [Aneurinibacillus aneurinilyticus]MED0740168.1 hypothetical protein [Aneurinibacillus aneurinilyticus]
MSEKRVRKPVATAAQPDLNKRTKKEWIESASPVFNVERFEMAGALFDCQDGDELSQKEVKQKLDAYLHPDKKKEEEQTNVDSTS